MEMIHAHGPRRLARHARALAALTFGLELFACGSSDGPRPPDGEPPWGIDVSGQLPESTEVQRSVAHLRERFPGVIGTAWADRFDRAPGDAVLSRGGADATVTIELPRLASGFTRVTDGSGFSVRFAVEGAAPRLIAVASGTAFYPAAGSDDADLLLRPGPSGVEDFLVLKRTPSRPEVRYTVDVSAAAGLRLVANTLELLDASGTPRLRVARPRLVDAAGTRHDARIAIEGCAVDHSPRAPWGRPVTPAGGAMCTVVVGFPDSGVRYPALLDPVWESTKNALVAARVQHTMTSLDASDNASPVLLAGGFDDDGKALASAELYEPSSRTFAATAHLVTARGGHTATALTADSSGPILLVGGAVTVAVMAMPIEPIERYQPDTATFINDAAAISLAGRGHSTTLLTDGTVLIAGGSDALGQPTKKAAIYNPVTTAFEAEPDMGSARYSHAAVLLPTGDVLLTGGISSSLTALNKAELYSPTSNTFSQVQDTMVLSRAFHTATLLADGRVLIAGGTNKIDPTNAKIYERAELYDGSFSGLPDLMSARRSRHTATRLVSGDVVLVGGFGGPPGNSSTHLSTTDVFSTKDLVFNEGPPMTASRSGHAAIAVNAAVNIVGGQPVPSEAVLVTGGASAGPPIVSASSSAELLMKAPGDACRLDEECGSGYCSDEVCCKSACDGVCDACRKNLKESGANDGLCGPAKAGTELGWTCMENNTEVLQSCDGAGNPVTKSNICLPNRCDDQGKRCLKTCAPPLQACSDVGWCDDPDGDGKGECQFKRDDGEPCSTTEQCTTGHSCTDGVCCNAPCSGPCEACDVVGKSGTCTLVPLNDQPHPNLDADGTPRRSACEGEAGSACRGFCTGTDATSCHYPFSGTPCGPSACICPDPAGDCSDQVGHQWDYRCIGAVCTQTETSCEGFRCTTNDDEAESLCGKSCAAEDECTRDFTCEEQRCVKLVGSKCFSPTVVRHAGKADSSCTEYVCEGTGCRTTCESTAHCLPPLVCNTKGHCVNRPEAQDPPACSARSQPAEHSSLSAGLLLAAIACAALRRRTIARRPARVREAPRY